MVDLEKAFDGFEYVIRANVLPRVGRKFTVKDLRLPPPLFPLQTSVNHFKLLKKFWNLWKLLRTYPFKTQNFFWPKIRKKTCNYRLPKGCKRVLPETENIKIVYFFIKKKRNSQKMRQAINVKKTSKISTGKPLKFDFILNLNQNRKWMGTRF